MKDLRVALKSAGLTQEGLAARAETDQTDVSKFESEAKLMGEPRRFNNRQMVE